MGVNVVGADEEGGERGGGLCGVEVVAEDLEREDVAGDGSGGGVVRGGKAVVSGEEVRVGGAGGDGVAEGLEEWGEGARDGSGGEGGGGVGEGDGAGGGGRKASGGKGDRGSGVGGCGCGDGEGRRERGDGEAYRRADAGGVGGVAGVGGGEGVEPCGSEAMARTARPLEARGMVWRGWALSRKVMEPVAVTAEREVVRWTRVWTGMVAASAAREREAGEAVWAGIDAESA